MTTANEWATVLGWTGSDIQKKIAKPKFPVFEGETDFRIRALTAIALGSDVWLGGVTTCGPKKMFDFLDAVADLPLPENESRVVFYANHLVSKFKKCTVDARTILCYVDAFVMEPTSTGTYHGQQPTTLEHYLEEFATENTTITNNLQTAVCCGVGNGSHVFLVAEGGRHCKSCNACLCRHCCWDHTYSNETGGAGDGGTEQVAVDPTVEPIDNATPPATTAVGEYKCYACVVDVANETPIYPPMDDMLVQLRNECHLQVPATVTLSDVIGLYDAHVYKYDTSGIFGTQIKSIKYPLCPPAVLLPTSSQLCTRVYL
jgi:hypothetical protein